MEDHIREDEDRDLATKILDHDNDVEDLERLEPETLKNILLMLSVKSILS